MRDGYLQSQYVKHPNISRAPCVSHLAAIFFRMRNPIRIINWLKLMDLVAEYLNSFVIALTRRRNLNAPRNVCDSSEKENKNEKENENVETQAVHNKTDVIADVIPDVIAHIANLSTEIRSKSSVTTTRAQTVKMALSRQKYTGILELVLVGQPQLLTLVYLLACPG